MIGRNKETSTTAKIKTKPNTRKQKNFIVTLRCIACIAHTIAKSFNLMLCTTYNRQKKNARYNDKIYFKCICICVLLSICKTMHEREYCVYGIAQPCMLYKQDLLHNIGTNTGKAYCIYMRIVLLRLITSHKYTTEPNILDMYENNANLMMRITGNTKFAECKFV